MSNPVYIEDGDIIRGPFKNDAEANHAMVTGTGPWRRREEMAASKRYVVVENTPGYLPEDDEPATFEDWRAAVRYMLELVRENRDYRLKGGEDVGGWVDRENGCAYLVDEGRPHDLGRSFEVVRVES